MSRFGGDQIHDSDEKWGGGVDFIVLLLPTGSGEWGVLGVGGIPVAILPSCQYMNILHYNCIDMNIVG